MPFGMEIAWMVGPFLIAMTDFRLGAMAVFLGLSSAGGSNGGASGREAVDVEVSAPRRPPRDQYAPRAAGPAVKLTMISEDVIHSLYVPAFRIKRDVLPGRYSACWFEATRTGEFHLFCAEYCGTNHSRMIGRVVVMEPAEYRHGWAAETNELPAEAGKRLFEELRCVTCHVPGEARPAVRLW